MEDNTQEKKENRKEEERINELNAKLEFAKNFLSAIGIDAESIQTKIDAIEEAKKNNDPQALIAALHDLLNTVGESTESAMPEIKQFKTEAIGVLKPIIDLLIKDSLLDIVSYVSNMQVESVERTKNTNEKLHELEAESRAHMLKCYTDKGFTRKEAVDLIKTELARPRNTSLSLPTTSVTAQSCGTDARSDENIVNDFVNLTRKNPKLLIEMLARIKGFPGGFPGMG